MFKLGVNAGLEFVDSAKLEDLQDGVGGNIETLAMCKGMVAYANESGMTDNLPPSAYIPDFLRYLGFAIVTLQTPWLFGPAVITGHDGKLTKKQQERIKEKHAQWMQTLE